MTMVVTQADSEAEENWVKNTARKRGGNYERKPLFALGEEKEWSNGHSIEKGPLGESGPHSVLST